MHLSSRIKPLIFGNLSLLVVVLGAMSNFLLILFLKKFLPEAFNSYSLYITYIAIIVSFGLIGFDQVMLRLSNIRDGKIIFPKDIFVAILISGMVAPAVISYYFSTRYADLPFYLLLLTGLSINIMILAYNVLRLNRRFLKSQLYHNGYKTVFLIAFTSIYFVVAMTIGYLIILATAILCLFSMIAIRDLVRNVSLSKDKTPALLNFFLSFSLNMALLTLLSYGERILIANELGEDVFGEYFYYSTVFLFPLTLVQYYVGFKELVYFKESVNRNILHRKLRKIIIGGCVLVGVVLATVMIDNGRFLTIDLSKNMVLVALLSVLGIVKLIYGLFSALMGAKARYQDIYAINIITALLMVVIISILYSIGITVNNVVLALLTVFIVRGIFIYYKYA